MRYPATPLPESCLSVPREVIPNFLLLQKYKALPQAGDRGVADKQYMVDVNGNIVDVVRCDVMIIVMLIMYCKTLQGSKR